MKKLLGSLIIGLVGFLSSSAFAQAGGTIAVKGTWANPVGGVAADSARMERSVGGSPWVTACTVVPATPGALLPTTCSDTPQPIKAADGSFLQYKFHVIRSSSAFGDAPPSPDFTIVTGAPLPAGAVTYSYTVAP